jgi:hypothetical protein
LPKHHRRAFLLRYLFELSSEDGAKRCGLRCTATYDTWTFEARKRLKHQVGYPAWIADSPTKRTCRGTRQYVWKDDRNDPHRRDERHD